MAAPLGGLGAALLLSGGVMWGGGVAEAAPPWLYVCNQDDASVSVIDHERMEVIRTIDLTRLGYSANAKPHHIAVEPDGSHWYVSLIGEGKVVKLDASDRVVGEAPFETPGMLALDPARGLLVVGRSMSAVNPPPRVGVIRTADMSIEEVDVFFPRPHAIVLNPESGLVYTASLGVNRIAALDPASERVELVDVEGPPHALMQFALSPDGRTLAISGEISHRVLFFDLSEDPFAPRPIASVEVERQPFDPIFTPEGRFVVLGNKAADAITVIETATYRVSSVLRDPRILQPHGATVSTDGRWIFLSNTNVREDHAAMGHAAAGHGGMHHGAGGAAPPVRGGRGSVTVLDATSLEITAVIEVGNNATGIATAPRP